LIFSVEKEENCSPEREEVPQFPLFKGNEKIIRYLDKFCQVVYDGDEWLKANRVLK